MLPCECYAHRPGSRPPVYSLSEKPPGRAGKSGQPQPPRRPHRQTPILICLSGNFKMDPPGKKVGTGNSPKIRCQKAKIRKTEKRVKNFLFSLNSIANLSKDFWFSFVIYDTIIVEIKKIRGSSVCHINGYGRSCFWCVN